MTTALLTGGGPLNGRVVDNAILVGRYIVTPEGASYELSHPIWDDTTVYTYKPPTPQTTTKRRF